MGKECLVIPTTNAETFIYGDRGKVREYTPIKDFAELIRFINMVRNLGLYRSRDGNNNVELDQNFQQLIMYGFVMNQDGKFLIYTRNSGQNYQENRLSGKVACGIGGHIEPSDSNLPQSFYREFEEESQIFVNGQLINLKKPDGGLNIKLMKKYLSITPVGLIKYEGDEVSKVHLGIACKIVPLKENVEIRIKTGENEENISWQYVNSNEYQQMKDAEQIVPEGWTEVVFQNELIGK